eukprot:COSAG02_NODE_4504_length_5285_cov_2.849402_6_plen_109_part_00
MVAPICKNDLVYLPKKVRRSLGGVGPLVLCVRVASTLSFLCLTTLEVKELTAAGVIRKIALATGSKKLHLIHACASLFCTNLIELRGVDLPGVLVCSFLQATVQTTAE